MDIGEEETTSNYYKKADSISVPSWSIARLKSIEDWKLSRFSLTWGKNFP